MSRSRSTAGSTRTAPTIPFVEALEEALCVVLDIKELEDSLAHEFDCATCPSRPTCEDEECEIAIQETERVGRIDPHTYGTAVYVLDQSRRFRKYDKRPKRWSVEFSALVDCARRVENARTKAELARERARRKKPEHESDD
jgi:hypothetical protein